MADEIGATPAALAVAFALANPLTASVLFGATSPAQVHDNVRALDLLASLDESQLEALDAIR